MKQRPKGVLFTNVLTLCLVFFYNPRPPAQKRNQPQWTGPICNQVRIKKKMPDRACLQAKLKAAYSPLRLLLPTPQNNSNLGHVNKKPINVMIEYLSLVCKVVDSVLSNQDTHNEDKFCYFGTTDLQM